MRLRSSEGTLVGGCGTPDSRKRIALLRRGLRLEYATLGWNVVGCVVLAVTAIAAGSVALAGFGIDSLIEILASMVVVWQLRGTNTSSRTCRALRIIAVAFGLLAVYIAVQSAVVLAGGDHPGRSVAGVAWLAVTAAAMFGLAYGKADTGRRIENPVLRTEARITWVDGALAVVVLVGVVLNAAAGWWWADPVAALVLVVYGSREAHHAWQEATAIEASGATRRFAGQEGDRGGEPLTVADEKLFLDQTAEHLGCEKWTALRQLDHEVGRRRGHRTGHRRDDLLDVRSVQSRRTKALDGSVTELPDHSRVIGAKSSQDQYVADVGPGSGVLPFPEQLQRRLVRPLAVIQQHQRWPRSAPQHVKHRGQDLQSSLAVDGHAASQLRADSCKQPRQLWHRCRQLRRLFAQSRPHPSGERLIGLAAPRDSSDHAIQDLVGLLRPQMTAFAAQQPNPLVDAAGRQGV